MKHFVILLILLSFSLVKAEISQPSDSVFMNLDEVVVRATTVTRKADKNIYTVDKAVKERSSSALNLLGNISIPGLSINEVMEKISSPLGNVQLRINGRESDIDKLKSINPDNIQKIEWIDNPGLRYGNNIGAVINIIVTNPTSGGSLMLYAMEGITSFFNNSSANVTINQGNSQWQAGAWCNFRNKLDIFREYNDRYFLPDSTILQRTQQPLDGYFDMAIASPYLSYNYYRPDTVNFFVQITYFNRWKQNSMFKGMIENEEARSVDALILTETDRNPRYIIPSVYTYFEHKLPGNQTVVLNASLSYNDMLSGREYMEQLSSSSVPTVDIINNIRSYTYGYYTEANYIREWDNRTQLTAGLRYNGNYIRSTYLDYNNRSVAQSLHKLYFFGEYMIPIRKVTITAGIGGTWNKSEIHGDKPTSSLDFTPRISINWRASDKSRWNLTYNNLVTAPDVSQLSPITQSIDGLQKERGNPSLKSYVMHRVYLRYSFSNSKNLDFSANIFTRYISHPIFRYYTWENDYILRSYSNEGSHLQTGAGFAFTFCPLSEWISMTADINYYHYRSRGKGFSHILDSWEQNFNLQVFHWNWSLELQFNNPPSTLWGEEVSRGEFINIISLSYQWRQWNFTAGMFMPFARYSQSEKVISKLVDQKTVMRTRLLQHMPFITVNCTLNWGHQKNTGNRKLNDNSDSGKGAQAASR